MINLDKCFLCKKKYIPSPNNESICYCADCEVIGYKKPKEKRISSIFYKLNSAAKNISVLINKEKNEVEYYLNDDKESKISVPFASYNSINYKTVDEKIKNIFLLM